MAVRWAFLLIVALAPAACAKGRGFMSLDGGPDAPADGGGVDRTADGTGGMGGAPTGTGGGAGGTGADGGTGGGSEPTCSAGQHLCAGRCVSDSDPQTCGGGCTPCQAPPGGTATCDGTMCGGTCPPGMQLCAGACAAAGSASCMQGCPAGTHMCAGGLCSSNQEVQSCGDSCTPCPVPAGASQATCDGTRCDFVCATGYHRCGSGCARDDSAAACGSSCRMCPGDPLGAAACVSGTCTATCNPGSHLCDGRCASDGDPATCGSSCTPCPAPAGGTATCSGGRCGGACPAGRQLCAGTCIPDGTACMNMCTGATHNCDGQCLANDSVNSCGSSCTPCPVPTGATGASCNGTTCDFGCGAGYHRCGNRCAANDDATACGTGCMACPTDPNGTAVCLASGCDLMCASGWHKCGNRCVSNSDPATCGQTSCTACQAPTGGSVSCNGVACVPACPTGKKPCNGACIDSTAACNDMCESGFHNCSGICRDNTSVSSCGSRCTAPCPSPPAHGMATCDGTDCDIACDADYRRCPSTNNCAAVAAPGCCTATDCTAGGPGTLALCNDNACSYPCNTPTFKQCGNACIPAASCCTPCTDGFTCKNGSCPTSCITDEDCVSSRHCRHGKCIPPITQLGGGSQFNCSLHQDLSVRCWGYNGDGELGSPGGADPRVVPLPMGVTHVAAGNRQACAVLSDNTVWCWGDMGGVVTAPAPYGGLTDVASVNLSAEIGGCAVLRSGGVRCWGTNEGGQLGIGSVDSNVSPPTTVPGLANVVEVSHGGLHVCVRKSDQSVACWGWNRLGELATGAINPQTLTVEPNPVPTPTAVAAAAGAVQVATNGAASFSLNAGTSSNLLAWGSYTHAGRGDVAGGIFLVPGSVGTTRFVSVSTQNTSCGVTIGQTVKCWGANFYGQAGAPPSGMLVVDPVDVPGLSGVGRVASGWDAVCATVQGDTDVVCWGNNALGQLGNTSTSSGPTPVAVQW